MMSMHMIVDHETARVIGPFESADDAGSWIRSVTQAHAFTRGYANADDFRIEEVQSPVDAAIAIMGGPS